MENLPELRMSSQQWPGTPRDASRSGPATCPVWSAEPGWGLGKLLVHNPRPTACSGQVPAPAPHPGGAQGGQERRRGSRWSRGGARRPVSNFKENHLIPLKGPVPWGLGQDASMHQAPQPSFPRPPCASLLRLLTSRLHCGGQRQHEFSL